MKRGQGTECSIGGQLEALFLGGDQLDVTGTSDKTAGKTKDERPRANEALAIERRS